MHTALALLLAAGAAAAPRPLLLKAARLFDSRKGELVEPGVVLLQGKTIAATGADVKAPEGAEVVDLGDATLLPGLIDAHTHVSFESTDDYYKDEFDSRMRPPAEQAHYAASYARKLLDAGFTTIRDLGSEDYLDVGLRNAIDAGVAVGPRILVAVHGLGARGGHADGPPVPNDPKAPGVREGICSGADQCRDAVRWQMRYGADVIKVMASGGVLSLADAVDHPQLTLEELTAIVEEAHRLGRKVAAHCHGDTAAKVAIKAGVDSLEHASFLKADTLAQAKERGVFIVPTLLATETVMRKINTFPPAIAAKGRAAAAAQGNMMREALRQGVRIALGTDSAVSQHGINARELQLMVERGMSPAQALRSATWEGAELLGLAKEIGALEQGKQGDVIAVPGDPLRNIAAAQRVLLVVKAGVVIRKP